MRVGVPAYESSAEPSFGPWADGVFEDARTAYGAAARRDATTLNILYPPEDPRFVRLRVCSRGGRENLGWVVAIHATMHGHRELGNLHVGTLVDGFGRAEAVPALLHAGLQHLARQGVDLVVANWSHAAWVRASRRLGFLPGPSNYLIFVSPGGAPLLGSECPLGAMHLTRGDCEGPGVLLPPLPAGSAMPVPGGSAPTSPEEGVQR